MWWLVLIAFADLGSVQSLVNAGRYREAVERLDAEPSRSPAWHVLASKAWDGLNDPAKAVAEAEAALEVDPRYEPAHVQLGFVFLSRNTPAAAVDVFTDAARMFPESLPVRLGHGLALKELQRYDEAERALAACWPHPLAVDALATVYLIRSKFPEAKALAARFVEANPSDYRGYYFLAAAKDGLQEADALQWAQRSLERKDDFAAAHALAGKIHLRTGNAAAAAAAFERAIRYRPDLTQAHLQLAQAYRKLGREGDAAREFAIVRDLKEKEARPKPSLLYHRGGKTQ
ncbi:MAG: tetratricopeptide repeat protein [Bryobacteraceae bacterium]